MPTKRKHSKVRSVTGVGLCDLLMPLCVSSPRRGPRPTYYLVSSKSGRPLNVHALAEKPIVPDTSANTSQVSGQAAKVETGEKSKEQTTAEASKPTAQPVTASPQAKIPVELNKKSEESGGKESASSSNKPKVEAINGGSVKAASHAGSKAGSSKGKTMPGEAQETQRIPPAIPINLPGSATSSGKGTDERLQTVMDIVGIMEDYSSEDIKALCEILRSDENERPLRIASRLHDKTGKRVHEDDIHAAVQAIQGRRRK